MARGHLYVILLIALVALIAVNNALMRPPKPEIGSTLHAEGASAARAADRPKAPELILPLQAGKPGIGLSSLRGKVVILDFWATWCGPCRMSIPDVEKVYKKYHSQGLEVIGISVDSTPDPVPAAVKELGMTYPIVLADKIPDVHSKIEFSGIPLMYIVDKQGRVAGSYEGYDPNLDLDAEIKPLLAE